MPIFAVDGSDIQIATNPHDPETYYPGSNGQKGYNLLHLNALYEINHHIYADSIIQKSKENIHISKANFSVASHLCRLFYRRKTPSPDLETIIAKNFIPIRTDRHRERKATIKTFRGFVYRVA